MLKNELNSTFLSNLLCKLVKQIINEKSKGAEIFELICLYTPEYILRIKDIRIPAKYIKILGAFIFIESCFKDALEREIKVMNTLSFSFLELPIYCV